MTEYAVKIKMATPMINHYQHHYNYLFPLNINFSIFAPNGPAHPGKNVITIQQRKC